MSALQKETLKLPCCSNPSPSKYFLNRQPLQMTPLALHHGTIWPMLPQFSFQQQQIHDRAGEFHCAKCTFKSRSQDELKAHDKKHRTCPHCGKLFTHLHKHKLSCMKAKSSKWYYLEIANLHNLLNGWYKLECPHNHELWSVWFDQS